MITPGWSQPKTIEQIEMKLERNNCIVDSNIIAVASFPSIDDKWLGRGSAVIYPYHWQLIVVVV